MIPSVLAQHVKQGVVDFLETTFPVSSPFFEGMLSRLLEEDGGVFKGPYLSVQLPFLQGKGGADFFPDVPLRFRPWLHQEKAFERLGGEAPKSTLVATGTGSGKTECFLQPILDHCYRHRNEPGIKAILIYPMNALATDQAGRIARAIWDNPKLEGQVTAGLYVGEGKKKGASKKKSTASSNVEVMTRQSIITNRATMRLKPPSILLTNYKMLDYLLMRQQDFELWKDNGPETLRFLVVDELHTFDGAQGTDLACLVRRIKARLRTPQSFLCAVGTSATLGGDGEGSELLTYAESVFGEAFDRNAVVTESRQSAGEFLGDSPINLINIPGPAQADQLDPGAFETYADYVRAQHELWLGTSISSDDFDDPEWRVALSETLRTHLFFHNLLKILGDQTMDWRALLGEIEKRPPGLENVEPEQRVLILSSLLALVSEARIRVTSADGSAHERLAPFLNVRVQLWLRELRRMVGHVAKKPRLRFADDLSEHQLREHLPVVHCRECGAMGYAGIKRRSENKIRTDLQSFYVAYFGWSPTVVFLFPEDEKEASDELEAVASKLCTGCLRVTSELGIDECSSCGSDELLFVQRPDSRVKRGERFIGVHDCPYCGTTNSLTVLGSRAASLTSVMVAQLFSSTYNDDKKLLTFSDSVQDAAHRAGFFAARTYRFILRAALQQFILAGGDGLTLDELPEKLCDFWTEKLGGELDFVATFLAPDLAWFPDYDTLVTAGVLPEGSKLVDDARRRVGWGVFAEYGFNCRIGRTLEKTSSSVIHADSEILENAIDRMHEPLRNEIGVLRQLDRDGLRRFLLGVVTRVKNEGGIVHPALDGFIESQGNTYTINRIAWMPRFGRFGFAPKFIAKTGGKRFDAVHHPRSRTWFQGWAEKSFDYLGGSVTGETDRVYNLVLPSLVEAGLFEERGEGKTAVWGLRPEALRVSKDVAQFRCTRCGHAISVAEHDAEATEDAPCLRYHCPGRYRRFEGGADYYGRLYATGDIQRVFAKEHTGLLERGPREILEREFKTVAAERKPWYPNLLSCTPTLEMGIDIGDLSSLILCSMPPAQASYLQRIGRTGRRDGNSLNLTVANARPHDLYFFAEPEEMLSGRVEPPGVFLEASAVIERQLTAYCFDRWVETGLSPRAVPATMAPVLKALQPVDHTKFPHNFLRFVESRRTALFDGFLRDFGVGETSTMGKHLTTFMEGDAETQGSLPYKIITGLNNREKQRKSLASKVRFLNDRIKKKKKQKARDQNFEQELADLEREKEALQGLMTAMTGKNVFNFFTDEGLLPNYAFPEAGVVLRSLIWRRKERGEEVEGKSKYDTWAYDHERPAASAIAELAPANRFYAGGRKVEIDQVDMSVSEIETWRLCRACSYSELVGEHEARSTCRRCSDTAWSDEGQKRQMLRMRQVFATTSDKQSRIVDDADDREPNFYDKQLLVDAAPGDIRKAFKVQSDELPFGFEFLARATFREINFGEKGEIGPTVSVAGVQTPRKGFTLCRHCGKVQKPRKQIEHALTCTARDPESDSNKTDCVYLYRDFTSEAIRILLPIAKFGESDRPLHSFVAALHLGLKKRFGGSIDHLRTALQEEPVPESSMRKQYLVLFDTVPGGTGYLKQLMLSQDQLMEVIEGALESLRDCSCGREADKDGCYRCLYAYRHSYDMKETSRRTAMELMSSILEHKGKLVETKTLRDVSVSALFDSLLEARFIEALRRENKLERPVNIKADVVDGRPGWFLSIGERAYTIELHRNLGPNDGAPVLCEVDFLFRPIVSRGGGKPICVFTDGFEFHKDRIGLDMAQRSGLLRSGRYRVWSLTWKDVDSAFDGEADFFKDYLDPAGLAGGAQQTSFIKNYGAEPLTSARTENSFQWLIRFLEHPASESCLREWKALAFVLGATTLGIRAYANEKARKQWQADLDEHVQLAGILSDELQPESPDALLGLFEQHGQKGNRTVRLFTSVTADSLRGVESVKAGDVSALRVLAYLRDSPKELERQGIEAIWTGFLRLTNLLQFLPRAAFVTQTGLEEGRYGALPPLVLEPTVVEAEPDPWDEIRDVVDDELHELLSTLAARGWPVPDDPPCDLVEASETIAEAELGWTELKIAVLDEAQLEHVARFSERGWTTFSLDEVLAEPQSLYDLHVTGDDQ